MAPAQTYRSPDGALTFLVIHDEDGDITLGFDGYSWHTHGDVLAAVAGGDPAEAARSFVDDLLHDRVLIAVGREDRRMDVWATGDPESDLRHADDGETTEFRFWSGARIYRGREILGSGARWRSDI